jgi:hypothetical protein
VGAPLIRNLLYVRQEKLACYLQVRVDDKGCGRPVGIETCRSCGDEPAEAQAKILWGMD